MLNWFLPPALFPNFFSDRQWTVGREIGVEQQQRVAADLHPPDLRHDRAAGELHLDQHRLNDLELLGTTGDVLEQAR